jgi:hypothetical protein
MSTPQAALPSSRGVTGDRWAWIRLRQVWAGLAIVAMWLAVLFDGIYGKDIVSDGSNVGGGSTVIPSAVVIAVFACIGTIVVARHGFRPDASDR